MPFLLISTSASAISDYDKYVVINGVRVRRGSGTKNWWGPVSAGVTLVWNIF